MQISVGFGCNFYTRSNLVEQVSKNEESEWTEAYSMNVVSHQTVNDCSWLQDTGAFMNGGK